MRHRRQPPRTRTGRRPPQDATRTLSASNRDTTGTDWATDVERRVSAPPSALGVTGRRSASCRGPVQRHADAQRPHVLPSCLDIVETLLP
jgi:hypothetical protein